MAENRSENLKSLFEQFLIASVQEEDVDEQDDDVASPVETDDSSEDDDDKENSNNGGSDSRSDNIVARDPWKFVDDCGVDSVLLADCEKPIDFYELFFNSDVLNLLVVETNRYGQEKDESWSTNTDQMKRFFGLCLQMGIVKLPSLRDYWSSRAVFGVKHPIGAQVMTRTRFESLLANLHLADNASFDGSDRLYKITPLLTLFNDACEKVYRPGKDVCIDESLDPFRGRIVFRQYLPNKRLMACWTAAGVCSPTSII
ncbi:unnamed protein product [Nippostrongylus brasiliensis]|uniref:PiggyBac transposable element-derived protein 4 (inferred by orthology to a human protein) n=1 Tax=Nippostrongylus brasiliensis TaxID=27835 RepID=A0A0N4XQL5_NIPBR|nr:unnamed protein product [Nippostrongylus brasiliensis]